MPALPAVTQPFRAASDLHRVVEGDALDNAQLWHHHVDDAGWTEPDGQCRRATADAGARVGRDEAADHLTLAAGHRLDRFDRGGGQRVRTGRPQRRHLRAQSTPRRFVDESRQAEAADGRVFPRNHDVIWRYAENGERDIAW